MLAVGVGQADAEELRRAVTDFSTQNILYTPDAAQLDSLHTRLAELLCSIAKLPDVRGKNTFLYSNSVDNIVEDSYMQSRQQRTELYMERCL